MDEIFRFLMLRPPEPADPIVVGISARFRDAIVEAQQDHAGRDALRVAAGVIDKERGIASLDELHCAPRVITFGRRLRQGLADAAYEPDLPKLIKEELGDKPAAVVASESFVAERGRLSDLLVAAKILSADGRVQAILIEDVLRLMDLVDLVANGAAQLSEADGVRRALTRPTLVGSVDFTHPPREPKPGQGEAPPNNRETELEQQRSVLAAAAHTLQDISPDEFVRPVGLPGDGPVPRPRLRKLLARRVAKSVENGPAADLPAGAVLALAADVRAVATAEAAAQPAIDAAATRLMVAAPVVKEWPATVHEGLTLAGVDPLAMPVPAALERVTRQLASVTGELAELSERADSLVLVGSSLVPLSQLGVATLGGPLAVPTTYGSVQPVGVGDLLVVREHVKKYEGGELAHVENVLDGEHRQRMHKRARTTEETVTVEVETKRDEERDTQSTERFELQRETATILKEDTSFKAGLSVSGSYGPTIEFKASADFAMNNAREDSAKTASRYSKEVTDRASTKVSERRREERILRTLEVFEEVNEHGIDNPAGNGHVVGAYQWLDKVYEAQVYNYGKRMMFDFMVPEPGAFWLHALSARPRPGAMLTRPVQFTLSPAQVTEYNYEFYVQRYQVSGVKPPPGPYITISKSLEGTATSDADGAMTKTADLPITDGYQAVSGHVTSEINFWETSWAVDVAVGNEFWRQQAGSFVDHYFTFDRETGSVPVAIKTFQVAVLALALEVNCQRTDRAMKAWQLETHASITQAWLKLERDYRDELAALEVQAAGAIHGRNPLENRVIERSELKKYAISTITAQHFDLFDAITTSAQGYPQPDLPEAEAEGRYIRFLEQAFEWEHMMYVFYPYYWGRKGNWVNRSLLQDVDSQFAEFLRAGAARVVVAVRPGFESAVAHFLDTGEIWQGADPPLLTSPRYVSIIQEIKERDDAPGTEVPQGNSWDVHLPTTLIRLRPDGSLPTWSKNASAEWIGD